ncbi:MAG: cupin domain-containing protein [Rhodothermales bacterium]
MIDLSQPIAAADLEPKLARFWNASAEKICALEAAVDPSRGAPVFTVDGTYTARGWTDWTQGFRFGSALLHFDATGETDFLSLGRTRTVEHMTPHVTHFGVHDHGFNNVSTYGTLLRLMAEERIEPNVWERAFYEMALACSGAVQARRWTDLGEGCGYIYSFNGPHSLFADTIRSLRSLALAHQLGHVLMDEQDRRISLLDRLIQHARTTARYSVYYGEGRDGYDVRGRVAHESIFNLNDCSYRCPNTQQGYAPFTTWTRGLAWIMCGFAEELEFLSTCSDDELNGFGSRKAIEAMMLKAARACCDYYIVHTPSCGVPYWDTGAPGLHHLGDYLHTPADPYNDHEPVDSSAAAVAAQGLLRLGHYLKEHNAVGQGSERYWQAGLKILDTLFDKPYLCTDPDHQGLILHAIYHWPNRWDHVPPGRKVACGEATMWGDYHAREAALAARHPRRAARQRLPRARSSTVPATNPSERTLPGVLYRGSRPVDLDALSLTTPPCHHTNLMQIVDLNETEGRAFPARRRTRNLVGGASPITSTHFNLGYVVLEPRGGQVPWHHQEQDEVYFIVEGTGEMCLGDERRTMHGGQAVFIPPGVYHQLTNIGETPLILIYCYGPAGDVAHWRQELDGTLPRAGIEAPPLPDGAWPQCTA